MVDQPKAQNNPGQPATPAPAATAPAFKIPGRPPRANAGKFNLQASGQCFDTWFYRADFDTTLELLLTPEYWAHVAEKIKAMDRVEVITAGGMIFAELIVLKADENIARMRPLRVENLYDLKPTDMETDTHKVVYKGEISQWAVVRKNDQASLRDAFGTPDEAVKFMRDHLRAVAA